jgi:hypothetical protein
MTEKRDPESYDPTDQPGDAPATSDDVAEAATGAGVEAAIRNADSDDADTRSYPAGTPLDAPTADNDGTTDETAA